MVGYFLIYDMTESVEIIQQVSALSYAGIFGLSLLANMVVPVPEEASLLAIGYVIGIGKINPVITTAIVIVGLLTSDLVIYTLSRHGNKPLMFVYNRFFAKTVGRNPEFLDKHIVKIIFFSRFLVQLRFIGPFLAGTKKISLRTFLTYELAALFIYVPTFLAIGAYFRNRFEAIVGGLGTVRNIIFIVLGAVLLLSFIGLVRKLFLGTLIVSIRGKEGYESSGFPGLHRKIGDEKKG